MKKNKLPTALQATLDAIAGEMSTEEVQAALRPDEIGLTAVSNRLYRLLGLNLVHRRRVGSNWKYARGATKTAKRPTVRN